MTSHAWIEVDLGAIGRNYQRVSRLMGNNVQTIAVVKANAYGHGLVPVSLALVEAGASTLAVTHVEEAALIRQAGCGAEILLLSPPRGEDTAHAVELALISCVMDAQGAQELAAAADAAGQKAKVHLRIDTGMGSLGAAPADASALAAHINETPELILNGVFSHCARGADPNSVQAQLATFTTCCKRIEASGIPIPIRHIAASAAALSCPSSRLNVVRIGTLLYGQYPSSRLKSAFQGSTLDLEDPWQFQSRIISIRTLNAGHAIGYGSEFRTRARSRIAVVPVGTADGLAMEPLSLRRGGWRGAVRAVLRPRPHLHARVQGQPVPIVGRVAMQMCALDITDIPEAAVGDIVTLPVRRLPASALIPRIYTGAG